MKQQRNIQSIQLLILTILLLLSQGLLAQIKSKLRVYSKPSEAIIKLDTMYLEYGKPIVLDSGVYKIEAWAPKRELVTKNIVILKGQFKTVAIKLPYTKEYKNYKRKNNIYKVEKLGLRYGLIIGYLIFAGNKYSEINDLEKRSDQHEKDALLYQNAFQKSFWQSDIDNNKVKFNNSKNSYEEDINKIDENWRSIQIGAGVTAVLTYFTWKISNKLKKPNYEEVPKLSNLQVNPIVLPNMTALQFNYQF